MYHNASRRTHPFRDNHGSEIAMVVAEEVEWGSTLLGECCCRAPELSLGCCRRLQEHISCMHSALGSALGLEVDVSWGFLVCKADA